MTATRPQATQPATTPIRVVIGVAAAIVVSVLLNLVVATVAGAAGVENFRPLKFASYSVLTVIGILAATGGWALIRRLTTRPAEVLRWLVPTVLVLSYVPDIAMLFTDAIQPNATGGGVAALMTMHTVVAVVTVTMLLRVLPVSAPSSGRSSGV